MRERIRQAERASEFALSETLRGIIVGTGSRNRSKKMLSGYDKRESLMLFPFLIS